MQYRTVHVHHSTGYGVGKGCELGPAHVGVFFRLAAMGLVAGVSFMGAASVSAVLIVARA